MLTPENTWPIISYPVKIPCTGLQIGIGKGGAGGDCIDPFPVYHIYAALKKVLCCAGHLVPGDPEAGGAKRLNLGDFEGICINSDFIAELRVFFSAIANVYNPCFYLILTGRGELKSPAIPPSPSLKS